MDAHRFVSFVACDCMPETSYLDDCVQDQEREMGVVVYAFNPSTWEAEAGRFLSELQDNQGYTEKPCLEKQKQN